MRRPFGALVMLDLDGVWAPTGAITDQQTCDNETHHVYEPSYRRKPPSRGRAECAHGLAKTSQTDLRGATSASCSTQGTYLASER